MQPGKVGEAASEETCWSPGDWTVGLLSTAAPLPLLPGSLLVHPALITVYHHRTPVSIPGPQNSYKERKDAKLALP